MALPLAIPIIMGVASLLGAAGSVIGGITGANAEKEAGRQRQEAANAQARVGDMSVMDALIRGGQQAGQYRTAGTRAISAQRVAYASTGVDVSSGTAVDVLASTRAMSELDALTAKNNAAREAWGFQQDVMNLRKTGQYARQAGDARATGSLLGGAAGAAQGIAGAATSFASAFPSKAPVSIKKG